MHRQWDQNLVYTRRTLALRAAFRYTIRRIYNYCIYTQIILFSFSLIIFIKGLLMSSNSRSRDVLTRWIVYDFIKRKKGHTSKQGYWDLPGVPVDILIQSYDWSLYSWYFSIYYFIYIIQIIYKAVFFFFFLINFYDCVSQVAFFCLRFVNVFIQLWNSCTMRS